MSYVYRIEIYPNLDNLSSESNQELNLKNWFKKYMGIYLSQVWEIRYFLIETDKKIENITNMFEEVFVDSVTQKIFTSESSNPEEYQSWLKGRGFKKPYLLDIGFRPGVTDNSAISATLALNILPDLKDIKITVSSGVLYYLEGECLSKELLHKMAYAKLGNELLHQIKITTSEDLVHNSRFKNITIPNVSMSSKGVFEIDLNVSDDDLLKMNDENCWALSLAELHHIKNYFEKLERNPTDVEIEVIAQSWSEHCKHKIFSSTINYTEGNLPKGVKSLGQLKVDGIFKSFIKGATAKIEEDRKLPWLVSVFHDNAGVVRFDDKLDLCIKVETHNSPSALDPYGGALTGILGVNRDILGVGIGAKPVANTNVFCLAENKYFSENNISLPILLKNPDLIKEGVHLGVQDGGNKSGIPTVNGAFVFDRDFVGKPLVFCGTVGVMPQIENDLETSKKNQRAGDLIVMAGGRIGKDGIHGATFSSMELVDGVLASVVQIGDPITQKRLGDFLLEARKKGLYNSLTDNGAGGLSSSIGEMAQVTNGAVVDLEKALVKYPGLSPYELMVSESQERMTFSVEKEKIEAFLDLAKKRNVEASVVGEFTNSGFLHIRYEGQTVGKIALDFLHESLLPMKLDAHFDLNKKAEHWIKKPSAKKILPEDDYKKILLDLLESPNIRSQEHLVRRYDHEVKGATIVKPYTGSKHKDFSGPSDAGVIWMKPHGGGNDNAIAIASGICPKISEIDSYSMAEYALDEAVRNAVSTGANPDEMVLVDNFCWPDPIESDRNPDAKLKLAHLVRAGKALYDLSISYGMPFVSGKDSMKNDFIGKMESGEKVKISVPPTLLVTAMGRVPSLNIITTSEFKTADSLIYLIGDLLMEYKSAYELKEIYLDYKVEYPIPGLNGKRQLDLYRIMHKSMREKIIQSSHDISDGGMLVALAESMMATSYGAKLDLKNIAEKNLLAFFFNESPGRFIVTVDRENQKDFEENFSGHSFLKLGETTSSGELEVYLDAKKILNVTGDECLERYKVEAKELN